MSVSFYRFRRLPLLATARLSRALDRLCPEPSRQMRRRRTIEFDDSRILVVLKDIDGVMAVIMVIIS